MSYPCGVPTRAAAHRYLRTCASISDLHADDFSRHNQLDATVLLSPLGGTVVGKRRVFAELRAGQPRPVAGRGRRLDFGMIAPHGTRARKR